MPGRLYPLVTNEIYHVFNRGIDHRPTFIDKREYTRALKTIKYYRFSSIPVRLSKFLALPDEKKEIVLTLLANQDRLVEVLAFCLMPNHYHLLIKQMKDGGISKFMSNFQNGFTRYFNRH